RLPLPAELRELELLDPTRGLLLELSRHGRLLVRPLRGRLVRWHEPRGPQRVEDAIVEGDRARELRVRRRPLRRRLSRAHPERLGSRAVSRVEPAPVLRLELAARETCDLLRIEREEVEPRAVVVL